MSSVLVDPIPEPELEDVVAALHARLRTCMWKARLVMLLYLFYEPREVTGLARAMRCDLSVTSRHLKALRAEGLVECRKEKNRSVHFLAPVVKAQLEGGMLHLRMRSACGTALTLSMPARILRRTVETNRRGRRAAA